MIIETIFDIASTADVSTGNLLTGGGVELKDIAEPLKIVIGLTILSLVPLLLVATTCFARFLIVFSMLRFALGLQQTPPNVVLISLSLFFTIFAMSPTMGDIETNAYKPWSEGRINDEAMIKKTTLSMVRFMVKHTRKDDLELISRLAGQNMPSKIEEVKFASIVPAFLLSELRAAFRISFVIFLPFLLVDLVVSSILMSLGMIMVPPTTISLPIKVLLFVVLDGWHLISEALISSVLK